MWITREDMTKEFADSLRLEFGKRGFTEKMPVGLSDALVDGIAAYAAELAAQAAESMREECARLAQDMGDIGVAAAIRSRIKV